MFNSLLYIDVLIAAIYFFIIIPLAILGCLIFVDLSLGKSIRWSFPVTLIYPGSIVYQAIRQ